jgi:hypothetical protein
MRHLAVDQRQKSTVWGTKWEPYLPIARRLTELKRSTRRSNTIASTTCTRTSAWIRTGIGVWERQLSWKTTLNFGMEKENIGVHSQHPVALMPEYPILYLDVVALSLVTVTLLFPKPNNVQVDIIEFGNRRCRRRPCGKVIVLQTTVLKRSLPKSSCSSLNSQTFSSALHLLVAPSCCFFALGPRTPSNSGRSLGDFRWHFVGEKLRIHFVVAFRRSYHPKEFVGDRSSGLSRISRLSKRALLFLYSLLADISDSLLAKLKNFHR